MVISYWNNPPRLAVILGGGGGRSMPPIEGGGGKAEDPLGAEGNPDLGAIRAGPDIEGGMPMVCCTGVGIWVLGIIGDCCGVPMESTLSAMATIPLAIVSF